MRILYWTQHYWPHIGGVEVLAADLIPQLQRRGFEVSVVTSHGNQELADREVHDGVTIHRFPFLQVLQNRDIDGLVACCTRLAALKRDLQPDVVHINFSDPSVFFHFKTEHAHPAGMVVTVHLAVPTEDVSMQSLLRRTLEHADAVIAPSNAIAADLRALLPAIAANCTVIYHGASEPKLAPTALPWTPPILLCAGRIVPEKGFDLAVEAFAIILRAIPATRLIVAGDGPERSTLEARARELGIDDSIEFLGWVPPDDLPAVTNRATLVLMPSRWREAFGQVALNASRMARPVIAANVGGLPEIVEHGGSGLLFERNDVRGLADAALRLLRDPVETQRMGARGRQLTAQRFDWNHLVDQHEAIYRQVRRDRGQGV